MRLLDASDLESALEIHKRCYRMLGWIEDALREDLPVFLEEHGPMDDVEAAERFLKANASFMPAQIRPHEVDDPAALRAYANYFATYLEVSFDVDPDPGLTRVPLNPRGCTCELCSLLVKAHAFRPKRVTSHMKARARTLASDVLASLGRLSGDVVDPDRCREAAQAEPVRTDSRPATPRST